MGVWVIVGRGRCRELRRDSENNVEKVVTKVKEAKIEKSPEDAI